MSGSNKHAIALTCLEEDNSLAKSSLGNKTGMGDSQSDQRILVSDCGAIAQMTLPKDWVECPQVASQWATSVSSRDFTPPGDPSATLSLYFRGTLVSEAAASSFQQILQDLPHSLSSEEVNSISSVLSTIADQDAFEKRSIQTAEIAGRRVLIIDGEWKTSQTEFHGLMIDADGSGREIQEVFFEASAIGFAKYINEVAQSIRTIEWKGR